MSAVTDPVAAAARTPTVEEFRAEALAFLEATSARRGESSGQRRWGEGDDSFAIFKEIDPAEEAEDIARGRAWRHQLFEAGLAWLSGPPEYGGRGLGHEYAAAWTELEHQFDVPNPVHFEMGLHIIGPTIFKFGTDAARRKYLRSIFRGDLICCQLFSEPNAGSDLASVETKAVPDGDEWVISGQKVWTSNAHNAGLGEVVCRTDPDVRKHAGISVFVVDMQQPGVEVRPLRQMTGGSSFNEVFLDAVRVPAENLLGELNGGWSVALHTLASERAAIGEGGGGLGIDLDLLAEMVRHFRLGERSSIRQSYAELYATAKAATWTTDRQLGSIPIGGAPGPELSLIKLALTNNMQRASALVGDILGPRLIADSGEWGTFSWGDYVLGTPGERIAGGTDEVMRTILAERVLGLPKG